MPEHIKNIPDNGAAGVPGRSKGIRFTETQNAAISRAISLFAFVAFVAMILFVGRVLIKFFSQHSVVLLPPITAVVLAMILQPFYLGIYNRFFHRHWLALTILAVVVTVPIAIICALFGNMIFQQFAKLLSAIPGALSDAYDWGARKMPDVVSFIGKYNLEEFIRKIDPAELINGGAIASGIGLTATSVGSFVGRFISTAFGWFALPIYTAILLTTKPLSGADAKKLLVFASPKTRDNAAYLIDKFLEIVVTFFRGQVLVAILQGILFGIGFHFVGLRYGLVLGLGLGLLNIVPYLGNFVGLSVTIPMALIGPGGGWRLLLLVLSVFCAVQAIDGYFITPRIMQNRTGLNPFVVIFSLFFWSSVISGAMGVLLAIPLSAFIVVFLQWLRREYFSQYDEESE